MTWQKLLHLGLAYQRDTIAELDAALAQASPRVAWLIAAEDARPRSARLPGASHVSR